MHILVVDDDETLRFSLRLVLEEQGYSIDEAEDGQDAVTKVKAKQYDAVILDVNMPRVNGLEALQRIKELNPQIICVVLTAHSFVGDAVQAIKHGAFDYVEKPADGRHQDRAHSG